MKDRLADGVARVRERVGALRGRDGRTGNRYVLLPAGAGRRRRIAEVGAVAGVAVVVLAFIGATVALRPSSSSSPKPDGPGLPAPTEAVSSESSVSSVPGSPSVPASSTAVSVPVHPGDPVRTGRFTPTPTATGTGSASPTRPAPTTRASVTAPPHTTPPHTTASSTPTPTATPPDTSSPTPTETPTTEPADPGDT